MCTLSSFGWGFSFVFLLSCIVASDPCIGENDGDYFYISTQADIDLIINCPSINHQLLITSNSTLEGTLKLPNLVTLESLKTTTATPLTGISLPQLKTVTNSIQLFSENITILDLPVLSQVEGAIILDLPALQSWSGTDSLRSVGQITIDGHNTSSLSFGSLSSAADVSVNFTSPWGYLYLNGTASPSILVTGSDYTIFRTGLENVGNIRILGCSEIIINSVSVGSLEIALNPYLQGFDVPNLVSLGPYEALTSNFTTPPGPDAPGSPTPDDSLLIKGNTGLGGLVFPSLTTIQGSMQITDNYHLRLLNGFPSLRNVTNDIIISGFFIAAYFPQLTLVGGDINFTSTDPFENLCEETVAQLYEAGIVKGNLYCTTPTETINLNPATPTPISSRHKWKLDKAAMIGTSFGVVILGLCISSILACWIIKKLRW